MVCFCCCMSCAAAFCQNVQSGTWFADGRSAGLGGSLFAVENECFRVHVADNYGVDLWQETDSVIVNRKPETDHVAMNKVPKTDCRAYLNGLLPYGMSELAVVSAGAVIDWNQYSWCLHGGLSGGDGQFVSLLFGHTVGQKWRYVAGVAMYRVDSGNGRPRPVTAFLAEAGMFYRPLESLQIGVWMGNPTLTHIDSMYFATDFHLGAVYDASERLQFVLEFEKQLQHSLFAHAGMEMAIWRPVEKNWRVDGRVGLRYPHTELAAGLGVGYDGKVKLHFNAAAVCDWKLGWSFAASVVAQK